MRKYTIKNTEQEKVKLPVEVRLKEYGDRVTLYVGTWAVFTLYSDGKGYLEPGIPSDNEEDLQTGSNGEIVVK